MRKVAVIGVGQTNFSGAQKKTEIELFAEAALDALTTGVGMTRPDLTGREVALLGAGGVARALVAGLTAAGADVRIYNRTAERAQSLAAEFGATAVPLVQLGRTSARIIINCTSLGMHPKVQESPVPSASLSSDMTVFDTVYNPPRTRLLLDAAHAGAKTISGIDMFINQAARQFSLWTNQPAPTDLMHQVLKDALL